MSNSKFSNVPYSARELREIAIRQRVKEQERMAYKGQSKILRMLDISKGKSKALIEQIEAVLGGDNGVELEMFNAINNVNKAATQLSKMVELIESKIDQLVDIFKRATSTVLWKIPLLILLYCIADKFGLGLGALVIMAPCLSKFFGDFWKKYMNPVDARLQSGTDDICATLTTLLVTCIVPKSANASTYADIILRRVATFNRTQEGFKGLFTTLIEWFEKLLNGVTKYFGGSEFILTDRTYASVHTWMSKVDAFERICTKSNPTTHELRAAVELSVEGIGYKRISSTPATITMVNKYAEKLGVLLQARRGALNAADAFRAQPVFVLLGGGSGVGKTILQQYIAVAALIKSGLIKEGESGIENLWQKGLSEYWNGYVQQKCLILDDIFQVKSPDKMSDSEFMQVIRLIGNWACPLNYADIESKGRFYFNSPLVMGSTNLQDIQSAAKELIVFPEAVSRRVQHGYWLEVENEYRDERGGFNYRKWHLKFKDNIINKRADAPFLDCIPWDAWRLYRHTFDKAFQQPDESAHFVTIKDLILDVANSLRERQEMHSDATDLSRNYFIGLAKDMHDAEMFDDLPYDEQDDEGEALLQSPEIVEDHVSDHMGEIDVEELERIQALIAGEPMSPKFYDASSSSSASLKDLCVTPPGSVTFGFEYNEGAWGDQDCENVSTFEADVEELTIERRTWREFGSGFIKTIYEWCTALASNFTSIVSSAWAKFTSVTCDTAANIIMGYFITPCLKTRVKYYALITILTAVVSGVLILAVKTIKATAIWFADTIDATLTFLGFKSEVQSNVKETTRTRSDGVPLIRSPALQAGMTADDTTHRLILDNCYLLSHKVNGGWKAAGTVQFVEGNMCMMPEHFITDMMKLADDTPLCFSHSSQAQHHFEMTVGVFKQFERVSFMSQGIDVTFVRFTMATIRAHRKITHLILTEDNVKSFFRSGAMGVTLFSYRDQARKGDKPSVYRVDHPSTHCKFVESMHVQDKVYKQTAEIVASTVSGDCGSPLLLSEANHMGGPCYLGMHHAGRKGIMKSLGFSHIITREMVEEARKILKVYRDDPVADALRRGVSVTPMSKEQEETVLETGLVAGSFLPLGVVDKPVSTTSKSKIKVSPMGAAAPLGPSGKLPARQAPFDKDGAKIYPMVKAMEAYQTPVEYREPPRLRLAAELVMQPFMIATKDCPRIVLDFEEAVVPPVAWALKSMPRDTSAGYPYKLTCGVGKTAFFGKDGDYTFTSDACKKLREDVDFIITSAKNNQRTLVICNDFLKDEVRPIEKVENGLTRAISAAPVDYTICVRMYFGAFLNAFLAVNLDGNFAPGMNPITDWGILVDKLQSKGNNLFAGDFKRFDASEQPFVHMIILDIIQNWYDATGTSSDEDKLVREILWLDLIHSRHLTGLTNTQQFLVQWNKSLPSGHPLTTAVNSMYCAITLACCYVNLTGDITNLHGNAMLIPFGDDNINSTSDAMRDVFNQRTVSQAMSDLFGLTYTSDKKGQALVDFEPLEDLTFLQRTFRVEPGVGVLSPLLDGSMLYAAYWHKNSRAVRADMLDNVQNTLGELSQHPREKWDDVTSKLYPWLKEHDMFSDLKFTTYGAAREWRMAHVDKWV